MKLIREKAPCKLYFDLEFSIKLNQEAFERSILWAIYLETFANICCIYIFVSCLKCSAEELMSAFIDRVILQLNMHYVGSSCGI